MTTIRRISRYIYVGASWIELAALFAPIFAAGMALFIQNSFWEAHIGIGYLVGWPVLILLVTAITGWIPRRLTAWLIGMTVLHAVHLSLPGARDGSPVIAALHPVTAVLLVGATYYHARLATRLLLERESAADPAGTAAEAG